jgi:hypothetical protein
VTLHITGLGRSEDVYFFLPARFGGFCFCIFFCRWANFVAGCRTACLGFLDMNSPLFYGHFPFVFGILGCSNCCNRRKQGSNDRQAEE